MSLLNIAHASAALYPSKELLSLISSAEIENNIPRGLLLAVAKTESNLKQFAVNIQGRPVFPKDEDSALKLINEALDAGITNIDIGVTQVNYKWHHNNFKTVEEMLCPRMNIQYAAQLLVKLKKQHGDWHTAIRHYHSANPMFHKKYSRKIVLCWLASN